MKSPGLLPQKVDVSEVKQNQESIDTDKRNYQFIRAHVFAFDICCFLLFVKDPRPKPPSPIKLREGRMTIGRDTHRPQRNKQED